MSSHCDNCRYAESAGRCSVGVCAAVRLNLMGKGMPVLPGRCRAAGPEPTTNQGVVGFRVADRGIEMFPPTVRGYIAARTYQGQKMDNPVLEVVFRYDREPVAGVLDLFDGAATVAVEVWRRAKPAGPIRRETPAPLTPEMAEERRKADTIMAQQNSMGVA